MATQLLEKPLVQHLVPIRNRLLRTGFQIGAGIVLLALLAQIRIELGPVPLTGQTLGVLLIGAAYGVGLGSLTVVAYLIVGGLGLGVFAGGASGWAVFGGPTAGYLIGFVLAAALVGYLAQRGWGRRFYTTALAMLLGNIVIYLSGLLWLSQIAPDVRTTLQWGLIPFLPGDVIKLLIAASLLPVAWRMLGKRT
ncbi:MAG: biotin transporter BioY [Trueperaceae bacterium]|nr:MAG: biotin transporter BioY [Trueperaceae bacterium]